MAGIRLVTIPFAVVVVVVAKPGVGGGFRWVVVRLEEGLVDVEG